jgi:hypothetical protein
MFGEYANKVDLNGPTLGSFSSGSSGGGSSWASKNPKTAAFLKNFASGLQAGKSFGQKDPYNNPYGRMRRINEGEEDKSSLAGTVNQLAEGLTETRDPFWMREYAGTYVPGKRGWGSRVAGAALGALGGFATGGPVGAVAGGLSGSGVTDMLT